MESTPLVLAYSHARHASTETHKANLAAASEEHDLAAGEFANAAKITSDVEALRTIKLLEQHHQKLSELLKFRPQDAQPVPKVSSMDDPPPQYPLPLSPPIPKSLESSPRHVSQHSSPLLPPPRREPSSSIASNLASARGIPANRQRRGNQIPASMSPQIVDGKLVNPKRRSRLGGQESTSEANIEESASRTPRPSALSPTRAQIPTPETTLTSPTRQSSTTLPATDDSFSRFYATFENLLSKLSAPLAFAGLPLNPTDTPPSNPTQKSEKPSPRPNASHSTPIDPDISRLFSRAALRAVREEHGLATAAESFYVVPTTGGTMSYAGMLTHTKHLPPVDEDELFVDASETPHSDTNPRSSADLRRRRGAGIKGGKTMEELSVENEALKAVAIDLGDRLRAFEMGAQRSSMALHMSMRAMQSPTASAAVTGKGSEGVGEQEARIRELEEEVRGTRKEMKRLARENQKLQGVVDRYRERWEILKDGARERMREDGREGKG